MKKSLIILLSVTSMTLVGCQSAIESYDVKLNKNTLQLSVHESETLTTTITPQPEENPRVVWVNSDVSVATVNGGQITALKKGTADITVYLDLNDNMLYDLGEPSDQCVLTVVDPAIDMIPVSSVTLNYPSLSLEIDEERQLTATILPDNTTEKTLIWLTNNPAIVTVNDGLITAKAVGNATITVYADENKNNQKNIDEKFATASVTVSQTSEDTSEETTVWVSSININATSLSLEEGAFDVVTATLVPSNATFQTVRWQSSAPSIATVNGGRVEAIKAGVATITAYADENNNATLDAGEKKDTLDVTVTAKASSSEPVGDRIPASGESLPIGNTTVSGPSNEIPVDITKWVDYDFSSSLPDYWSFIMGNNKKSTSSDFYAESSGGGFKFAKTYYGLQSPLLESWLKTEVRLKVSQVQNNSQSQSQYEGKPIFHIYSYDNTGHYIGMQTYDQRDTFKNITEIKFYIANPEMAYFEIRLNAYPYKGSQCYNFGVSQISLKGWPYDL